MAADGGGREALLARKTKATESAPAKKRPRKRGGRNKPKGEPGAQSGE